MYIWEMPKCQDVPRTSPLVSIVSKYMAVAADGTLWQWGTKTEGGQLWRYVGCVYLETKRTKTISRFVKWEQSLVTNTGSR